MSKTLPRKKIFEWHVTFVVEGSTFPSLPKSIDDECILERLEGEKLRDESTAILVVKVYRESIPSDEECNKVEKAAYEKAQLIADFYSLFVGQMRVMGCSSITQVTPYKGQAIFHQSIQCRIKIKLNDHVWSEKAKPLSETKTLNPQPYVSLALAHYGLALWQELNLKFLNLMISIEALYNSNPQELSYRISHRVANLLGRTEKDRQRIFKEIHDFYVKRNVLVHGLNPVNISEDDVERLRRYSKCSLLIFLRLGQKKDKILNEVDEAIYDEAARQKIQEKVKDIIEH